MIERLSITPVYERLRTCAPVSSALQRAVNTAHIAVIDAPVLANGRLELRHYLREQAIAQLTHRYGNLLSTPGVGR
ncbi:MAG: hypothetical protein NT075_19710 [Chloroflexi bacterium]|nr:hypothetical protein [Chloroflexota bacterium]